MHAWQLVNNSIATLFRQGIKTELSQFPSVLALCEFLTLHASLETFLLSPLSFSRNPSPHTEGGPERVRLHHYSPHVALHPASHLATPNRARTPPPRLWALTPPTPAPCCPRHPSAPRPINVANCWARCPTTVAWANACCQHQWNAPTPAPPTCRQLALVQCRSRTVVHVAIHTSCSLPCRHCRHCLHLL